MARRSRARMLCMALCLALSAAAPAGPRTWRDIADTDVDRSMAEIKRYLYGQQTKQGSFRHYWYGIPSGGTTAIALFALLEAGEPPSDPRVERGLEALVKLKTNNLYVIATRVMVLSRLARNAKYRKQLDKDMAYLTRTALRHGAWGYGGPERTGDNSCSQFALLALWEADRAGLRIKPALVRKVEATWLVRQRPDGGWTYAGQGDVNTASTLTMTTAALASLYICQDMLATTCAPYRYQSRVDRAWTYLAKHLKEDYYRNGYLAFCVQRVGMASGRKFIAGMDWFAAGAGKLCEPNPYGRSFRGRWGPVVRASFELIFLARGRIPLTFNKLAHGDESDWNYHGRDLAHFTEYMRREYERPLRWQIVRITDDVRMLLDAPILLVTGVKAPTFSAGQWDKLRQYALRGGTLLFVPTHNSKPFAEAVRERLKGLFGPDRNRVGKHYQLQKLDDDHAIYSVHMQIHAGSKFAPMWGVSDGTRLLAVLCERDLCCAWQRRATRTSRLDYHLSANFFMYATGASRLRTRLRPVFVSKPGPVRHHAKVAWLRHGGNWASQPYALEYLSQKLTAENRIKLDVSAPPAITDQALKNQDLAWLVGSEPFELSDEAISALRRYLDAGGTLFLNAVGGARAFNTACEKTIRKILGERYSRPEYAMPSSPLLTGKCGDFRGPAITKLERTRAWQRASREAPRGPLKIYRLKGRAAIIHGPWGIHDTLDGHTAHDARSYMPRSARDLAANVLLYALANRIK